MTNIITIRKTDDAKPNIGVTPDGRAEVALALSGFLASTYTLYMKTLYYHWNVTGPQFHSLHGLFEEQYEDLHKAGDSLAERIRALGHKTPGTFAEFSELSDIHEDAALPKTAEDMVQNLLRDNETCTEQARAALKIAEDNADEVTVDMLIARMATHDEAAWMLRATIE